MVLAQVGSEVNSGPEGWPQQSMSLSQDQRKPAACPITLSTRKIRQLGLTPKGPPCPSYASQAFWTNPHFQFFLTCRPHLQVGVALPPRLSVVKSLS